MNRMKLKIWKVECENWNIEKNYLFEIKKTMDNFSKEL